MKILCLPILLAMVACNKPNDNKPAAPAETKQTIMNVVRGSGEPCPDISGYYICQDSQKKEEAGGVEFKVTKRNDGHTYVTQQVDQKPGSQPSLMEDAIERYLLGHEGAGANVNGNVFEHNILGFWNFKYAVNCTRKSLSFHNVSGQSAYRLTAHQLPNGDLKLETYSVEDEGELQHTIGNCAKSIRPQPQSAAPKAGPESKKSALQYFKEFLFGQ